MEVQKRFLVQSFEGGKSMYGCYTKWFPDKTQIDIGALTAGLDALNQK